MTTRARSALVLARSGRSASIGSFTPSSWESGGSYRDPPPSQTDARSISGMGPTIPGPGSKTTAGSGLARPTLSKCLDLRLGVAQSGLCKEPMPNSRSCGGRTTPSTKPSFLDPPGDRWVGIAPPSALPSPAH